jgi:hypothetical protein
MTQHMVSNAESAGQSIAVTTATCGDLCKFCLLPEGHTGPHEAQRPVGPTQSVKRLNGSYVQAQCSCGWTGVLRTIRTVEGWSIAERDAKEHGYCHENGLGWFDYSKGWVPAHV